MSFTDMEIEKLLAFEDVSYKPKLVEALETYFNEEEAGFHSLQDVVSLYEENDYKEVSRLVKERKISQKNRDQNLLLLACYYNHTSLAKALIKLPSTRTYTRLLNGNLEDCISLAIKNDNYELTNALFESERFDFLQDFKKKGEIYHYINIALDYKHYDLAKEMVKNKQASLKAISSPYDHLKTIIATNDADLVKLTLEEQLNYEKHYEEQPDNLFYRSLLYALPEKYSLNTIKEICESVDTFDPEVVSKVNTSNPDAMFFYMKKSQLNEDQTFRALSTISNNIDNYELFEDYIFDIIENERVDFDYKSIDERRTFSRLIANSIENNNEALGQKIFNCVKKSKYFDETVKGLEIDYPEIYRDIIERNNVRYNIMSF